MSYNNFHDSEFIYRVSIILRWHLRNEALAHAEIKSLWGDRTFDDLSEQERLDYWTEAKRRLIMKGFVEASKKILQG